jgi:multidrug resistance protein
VTTPIYGRLADIYGRKPVFVAGSSVFLVGSAACGFTWSMASLVVFRIIQGLGAGCIQSVATTIVGDIYAPSDRARVQGWLSGVWALAAIIGPILGAFIVEQLHWAFVFWINLPIGAVTIWLLCVFLNEEFRRCEHQIDYLGSLLLMLGLGAIMTVMVQAQSLGPVIAALLTGTGLGALAWLAVQERRTQEPVIPIALLRNRVIAIGNLGSLDHRRAADVRRRFSADLCAGGDGAECRDRRLPGGDAIGCLELRQHRRRAGDGENLVSLDRRRGRARAPCRRGAPDHA